MKFAFEIGSYVKALIMVAVALSLRLGIEYGTGTELPTFITFYPIVMVTALGFGIGPGLFATAASMLVVDYFIFTPFQLGSWDLGIASSMILFAGMGIFMCVVARRYCKMQQHMESLVEERTRALRESEDRLALAHVAANAGAWEWDLRTNDNYWSEELWQVYGLEPHSCKPSYESWLKTIHPFDRDAVMEAVLKAASSGEGLMVEWRVCGRDGAADRWLMSRGKPLRGADGTVTRYVGIVMDITERKQAEMELHERDFRLQATCQELEVSVLENKAQQEELQERHDELALIWEQAQHTESSLRESENRFRDIVSVTGDWIWEIDRNAAYTFASGRVKELLGYDPEELIGRTPFDLMPPDEAERVRGEFMAVTARREAFVDFMNVNLHKNGDTRFVQTSGVPVFDEQGEWCGYRGVDKNITDRRKAEQLQHTSEERLDLLAETASQLLHCENPQEIIESLCSRVMSALDCHVFINFLVHEEQQRLYLNSCSGISEAERQTIEWLDFGVAVCGCAARDACRIVAEDIPHTSDPRTELVKTFGVTAYACHPLMVQDRVIGTLSFGSRTRVRFNEDDLDLMKAVADHVAIAIERMQTAQALYKSHDELEQRVVERTHELEASVKQLKAEVSERTRAEKRLQRLNRLYSVLSETNQTIVRSTDRDSLFHDFCRIAVEYGGFLLSWVGLVDRKSGQIRRVAAFGATDYLEGIDITNHDDDSHGLGPTGTAVREGTYAICNDFQGSDYTRPWHERGAAFGVNSSASIAIREGGVVIGALTLYAGEINYFDRQHVELLQQMGADVSFALDNMIKEKRRLKAEETLREETLQRLQAVEALRRQEHLMIQQNRQAAMGEMIGNIAHQWRQPLNTLGLLTQRLGFFYGSSNFNKEFLDTSVAKSMEIISYMSRTIDDFRTFFAADREKSEFRVDEAVSKVLSLVEASFKDRRINLERDEDDDVVITGYPNEYAQVLLNILINAKDAMNERNIESPWLKIAVSSKDGTSLVTIADNAGGISEDIVDKIFDPYFTTKGPQQGTGIGLFMAKSIIETNMGGRLSVRNTGAGAEFRIEV